MAEKTVKTESSEQTANIFGAFDAHAGKLEEAFSVSLRNRGDGDGTGDTVSVSGEDTASVDRAVRAIETLKKMSKLSDALTEQSVDYVIQMVKGDRDSELSGLTDDCVCLTARGKAIKAKTVGQKKYVEAIKNNTVTLGVGPAGTGKTFLAVAMAVKALRAKEVSRIILTRPAVEAGEKLGFLPGDLQDKVDPYLRPLYDALFDMFGAENFSKYMEKGIIEVAPLAYMRGRTLEGAFIILDEAQNTTSEQIKMFLTRLGNDSKMVITGDVTQIDLPDSKSSGLVEAMKVLRNVDDIAIHKFNEKDVVRHKLVQDIVKAYEKYTNERRK
ncbi:MAG: PhoH family protein [Oscillospiraceae bacterium]|nr:PhoH family protein [Oscillospiraceae bacterium]